RPGSKKPSAVLKEKADPFNRRRSEEHKPGGFGIKTVGGGRDPKPANFFPLSRRGKRPRAKPSISVHRSLSHPSPAATPSERHHPTPPFPIIAVPDRPASPYGNPHSAVPTSSPEPHRPLCPTPPFPSITRSHTSPLRRSRKPPAPASRRPSPLLRQAQGGDTPALPFLGVQGLKQIILFVLEATTKYCTEMPPQTRFKSKINSLRNESFSVPAIISRRSALGPLPVKKRCLPNQQSMQIAEISIDNEAENLEESPLDIGTNEQEFHPSIGVDERDSEDVVENNSSNVLAALTSISKVNFEFVNQEGMPASMEDVNKFCFKSIQTKLKEWRCELKKKGYMKGKNEELSVEPPEHRISQGSWDCLVQYWGTDEKVRESERNKNNRALEQATHTLGARSIARHNQEREKVIKVCQEKDLMNSSDPTVLSPILDAICNGHHGGYERGCGLGWSRMSRRGDIGNLSSNDNIKQLTTELQKAMAEIEALHAREKEREEAMHAREKEREEAMQAREREMQARMEHMEAMQASMERMEAMLSMHFSKSSVGDLTCHHAVPNNHADRDGS
ncbi:hypothetical protein Taro_036063, partial [Colocasia esculenta]|nr:hypothetical protein [Colocasia esculenta]